MKIDTHENFIIVKENINNFEDFITSLNPKSNVKLSGKNIIIDLLEFDEFSLEKLSLFSELATIFRKYNNSFVIVNNQINLNEIPDDILVVPSLQEAEDIVEMETIERELGM
ncbi:ribonuclease Z [Flavobacteriaceae bacterium]|jgi:hypothetical protein|nr:ribonuclease Z [Flavobacteriaceae bacterium]MDC6468304.1 ribonuclease Z [Flavobacteriaceae bacterium]